MCDKNITGLLDVDFSTTSDEFNWVTDSGIPIETDGGQLKLIADSAVVSFNRGLGDIAPENDRIRVQANFDIYRPQDSANSDCQVGFGVYFGSVLIEEFTISKESLGAGEKVEFNFDRVYKYEELSGAVSLKVRFLEGYENQILLDYLKAEHFKYCQEEVRTYFVLDQFLENSFGAVSSGFKLLEYKIDGIETLTTAFFNEILSPGGNFASRRFAKAEIDGSNRVSENSEPNSFNPFANDFGLVFDSASSYYGGKPIQSVSGSSYGAGIMNFGFDKPSVLNGDLASKKGAFFVDVDFSKSLKIVFEALVNDSSANVYESPTIYRKYFIEFDAQNCLKKFYYKNILSVTPDANIDAYKDGFLSGITDGISSQTVIACDQSFDYSGASGVFEMEIDFGTDIGVAGINYEAYNLPDKFEIEWNGQIYSSGYRGLSTNDQSLINAGVPPSEIQTANPSNGNGNLTFYKDQATPTKAKIRVTAPLGGTSWMLSGICPTLA